MMDNIKDIGDKVYIINAIGNNITLMQILIKFLMTTINFYIVLTAVKKGYTFYT